MQLDVFNQRLDELYQPPARQFTFVDVPPMQYMMIDGEGDLASETFKSSVKWLFSLAHFIKPHVKEKLKARFVEPPLECLFWSDRAETFSHAEKADWKWRVMIVVLDLVTPDAFQDALAKATARLGPPPPSLRFDRHTEGRCVQTMHVGDHSGIATVCRSLYGEFLPAHQLKPSGHYHEIYLNDPARVAPGSRKTVIRQPVA